MSKSKNKTASKQAEKPSENSGNRRRMLILTTIFTSFLMMGGVFAQWTGLFSATQKKGEIAPASFGVASPSKEYVYGGGKLIATEEPSGTPCGGGPPVPTSLTATAISTTAISLAWNASAGAVDHYEIERKSNGTTIVFNVPATPVSVTDSTGISANIAYVYRVRAVDTSSCVSSYSSADLATTTIFSDSIVPGVTVIKANPLIELRTAVNAVRTTAGLTPFNWDNPAPAAGGNILKAHIEKLRDNLDLARSTLGLPSQSYTDPTLTTGTVVRAAHILDIRTGVQ